MHPFQKLWDKCAPRCPPARQDERVPGTAPPHAGKNVESDHTIRNHNPIMVAGLLSAFLVPELHILGSKAFGGFVLFSNNSNIIDPSKTMKPTSIKNKSHLDPPQAHNW